MACALFFDSYRKHLKTHRKTRNETIMATIKLEAAEKIIAKAPSPIILEPDPPAPSEPKMRVAKSLKNCLHTLILTTTTLVGTYYLSVVAIASALALAAVATALTGPIGIGIACATAVLLGGYFAYKQYQSNKQVKREKMQLDFLEEKLIKRGRACADLEPILNPGIRPQSSLKLALRLFMNARANKKDRDPTHEWSEDNAARHRVKSSIRLRFHAKPQGKLPAFKPMKKAGLALARHSRHIVRLKKI